MNSKTVHWIGTALVRALVTLWCVFPIYWALKTSLSTTKSANAVPAEYVPRPATGSAYSSLLDSAQDIVGATVNSIIEAGGGALLTCLCALPAAYALARLSMRLKALVLGVALAVLAIPTYTIMLPVYRMFIGLKLLDTHLGVILVYSSATLPLALWILYTYVMTIPRELSDAAAVDGCSDIGVLIRIVLPLAWPGIVSAGLISFLAGWSQFLIPLLLTSNASTAPLAVAVAAINGQKIVPWPELMAAGILAILPPVLIAAAFQRRVVAGLAAGAVK